MAPSKFSAVGDNTNIINIITERPYPGSRQMYLQYYRPKLSLARPSGFLYPLVAPRNWLESEMSSNVLMGLRCEEV